MLVPALESNNHWQRVGIHPRYEGPTVGLSRRLTGIIVDRVQNFAVSTEGEGYSRFIPLYDSDDYRQIPDIQLRYEEPTVGLSCCLARKITGRVKGSILGMKSLLSVCLGA